MEDGVYMSNVEKLELPPTLIAFCSFVGFCNFYSGFLQGVSMIASALLEKLKVGQMDGNKNSRVC